MIQVIYNMIDVFLLCCLFLVVVLIYLFFFFKQKTAYEMRISDWSSDVCSSDLRAIGPLIPQGTPAEKEAQRVAAMSDQGSAAMENQFTYRSDLARKQIAAVDQIILTHKFDDPNLERLRKKDAQHRSEEHTSELQSIMRISYDVVCMKTKITKR